MKPGQDSNFRQQISALTPQERRQKHQQINAYLANLRKEHQRQQAAVINELELTGECYEQKTQDNRHQGQALC